MNSMHIGAHKRQNLPMPCGTGNRNAMAERRAGYPGVLSTSELRRLVAAMVD